MNPLDTPRLRLIPATATLVEAEMRDREAFFRLLGVPWAADWPPPETADALPLFLDTLERDPSLTGWLNWYWIRRQPTPELVGGGGFKGAPGPQGEVEVGYSVRTEHRRKGYATEAVGRLVSWALDQPGVTRVVAETDIKNVASIRTLERLGFVPAGPGSEAGLVRFAEGVQP